MVRPSLTLLAVAVLLALGLAWITLTWGDSGAPLTAAPNQNAELMELTGTTARLSGQTHLRTAVAYAQAVYAAYQDPDRPGAVLLVRDDDPPAAIAATCLQHMPVNAPMLFVTDGGTRVPDATMDELLRLNPKGVMVDNNVQVYLAGKIPESVQQQVEKAGFRVRRLFAENAVALAEELDEFLAVLKSNHSEEILIAATQAIDYAFAGANWNAHRGSALAFVTPDGVPPETRRILRRRGPGHAYLYLFAPPDVVSASVVAELSRYGHIQRIPGTTPQEMAVRWAAYRDEGRRLGWWFGERARCIGWGITEPGHNAILANPADWREVVPTSVLSHLGKHAFLLLTNPDGTLPASVRAYLQLLKPARTHPSQQIFNFGWIAGQGVPAATARQFSDLLRVAEPSAPAP